MGQGFSPLLMHNNCYSLGVRKVMVENLCDLFTYATINLYSVASSAPVCPVPSLPLLGDDMTRTKHIFATIIGLLLLCQ